MIPLLVVGLIWGSAGGVSVYRNKLRADAFNSAYEKDPIAFVESEDRRVDGFTGAYRYLLIGWSALILAGLAIFLIWGGNQGRAIGLGLILFGVSGLLVDHTSEKNAYTYKAEIDKELISVRAE